MSLSDSCTVLSFSQASGCSADSPISLASSPASSVSSVSLAEESFHRKSSCSADSPISLASSPETSATSCDTLPVPGTEALEANPGLDSDSGATTWSSSSSPVAADNATIPIPDNGDRIRALMAKYEQVMSGDSAKTQRASSADEGSRTAILPLSRDDNDRIDDKPTTSSTPRSRPSTRGTRGSRKGHSEAQSRVQKKRASVSRRYAYAFERLGGARRAARGSIEYEVYWASTWLPLDQLEGDDALQEARDLVVDLFGPDMWHSEARKLGLL